MMARAAQTAAYDGWRRFVFLAVVIVAAGASSASLAGTLGGAPEDGISLWRVAGALLLCVILAVAAAFALRARMGYPQLPSFRAIGHRRLRLIETLRLGRQVSLSIVACDGRELLILSSEQTAQLVKSVPIAKDTDSKHADGAP